MEREDQDSDKKIVIWGVFVLVAIVCAWLGTYFLLKDKCYEDRGTLGDMFGTVNALFSGLALAGIIFTILLQRKELGYQRDELSETRLEFKIQNTTLRLQRFENTFFNLLTLHHQIVDSIDLDIQKEKLSDKPFRFPTEPTHYDRVTLKGRDVFKNLYDELFDSLKLGVSLKQDSLQDINRAYLSKYETVQTDFGHYFRNLYLIIKLVDETEFHSQEELKSDANATKLKESDKYSTLNQNSRYKYTSMIRAQLSDYELLWLFYNCLSPNGNKKFKPLIEKYSLLKNMPHDKLHRQELAFEYEESAFKKLNFV